MKFGALADLTKIIKIQKIVFKRSHYFLSYGHLKNAIFAFSTSMRMHFI